MIYIDQEGDTVFTEQDVRQGKDVPSIILDSPRVERKGYVIVNINYPTYEGYFTLTGKVGHAHGYVGQGKLAYVNGGKYEHRDRRWSSEIIMMSPSEYIMRVHNMSKEKGSKLSLEELIEWKLSNYDIKEVFSPKKSDISPIVIDYKYNQQEGMHRALFAQMIGLKEIPVIVIRGL